MKHCKTNIIKLFLSTACLLFGLTTLHAQKVVALDNWFNHEINAKTGKIFHYTWNDSADSGFSQLGAVFTFKGAKLATIAEAPTKKTLAGVDIYIIVDPDTTRENPNPNYVRSKDIKVISGWVKKGGMLLLMANDGPNCEFTHFNKLAEAYGFHFVPVTLNPVTGKEWEMGAETNLPDHPLFKGVKKIYMKEVAPIILSKLSKPVLKDGEHVFIAETTYGKGYVLAIGDPWIYNEYIGHSRLPESFENGKAAENLCSYLIKKSQQLEK
jgi:unsaturated rhamnogalacturonyl hydrolase